MRNLISFVLIVTTVFCTYLSVMLQYLVPELPTTIIVGLFLILIVAFGYDGKLYLTPVLVLLFIFIIGSVNAWFSGFFPFSTRPSRENFLICFMVLIGLHVTEKDLQLILKTAMVISFIDICSAIYIYFTDYFSLYRMIMPPGFEQTYFYDNSTLTRAYGLSVFPIITAANAFLLFFFSTYKVGTNSYNKSSLFWAAVALASMYTLILTQSRLYVVSAFLLMIVWLCCYFKAIISSKLLYYVFILLTVSAMLFINKADEQVVANVFERYTNKDSGSHESFYDHIAYNLLGVNEIIDEPFGKGPGYASVDSKNSKIWVESTWLKIGVEEGVAFIFLLAALCLKGLLNLFKDMLKFNDPFRFFQFSIAFGLFFVGISFPVGLYLPNVMVPGILLGIAIRSKSNYIKIANLTGRTPVIVTG